MCFLPATKYQCNAHSHQRMSENNLESAETVRTKYATTVDSMVLEQPLERLLQTQYIRPLDTMDTDELY